MDLVNKFVNQAQGQQQPQGQQPADAAQGTTEQKQGGLLGSLGGLGDKLNNAAGGGQKGEKDEDYLDKAIDMVQEKVLKQGPQDNESATEQAKDKAIAGFVRDRYKGATGKEFPISEKKSSAE